MDKQWIDDMGAALRKLLAQSPAADIEKNLRALLASRLASLNLVTREEFDAQSAVLARTREKLEALERKLDDIESASAPR